ncbi:MAG: matrixin family metalloprotease [Puniceicoccales bacterium]
MLKTRFPLIAAILIATTLLRAASIEDTSPAQVVANTDAIAIVAVSHIQSYEDDDGHVRTSALLSVIEPIKGTLPQYFYASQPGGQLGDEIVYESSYPPIQAQQRALAMLVSSENGPEFLSLPNGLRPLPGLTANPTAREAGTLTFLDEIRAVLDSQPQPGADYTRYGVTRFPRAATVNGLSGGLEPRRFLAMDRGHKLRVVYDDSPRPDGISVAECREALEEALAAWSNAAGIDFEIVGTANFPSSANNVTSADIGIEADLFIEFGDPFNRISNASSTLGLGGQSFSFDSDIPYGGTIDGLDFGRANRGNVTLDHVKATLEDLDDLKEVLTHEVGHAIGLAHTSEDPNEPNAAKENATMYFRAHKDGRGASVTTLDSQNLLQAYPADNHPPFGYDRYVRLVTGFSAINNPSINRYRLAMGDLDNDPISIEVIEETDPSKIIYTINNNEAVTFIPQGAVGDSVADPPAFFSGRRLFIQINDGQHKSGAFLLSVAEIYFDSHPNGNLDGLPNSWMLEHFGQESPGVNMGPNDDFDSDGDSNVQEFLGGTNPSDASDFFQARFANGELTIPGEQFQVLELKESTDLDDFTTNSFYQFPDDETALTVEVPFSGAPQEFFRIERVD